MAKFSKFSSVCHTCGLCESDFSKRIHFVLHIKSHDIVNQHLCNTCGKIFHTLEHLEEHVRHYHTKMYPCVQCDKTYSSAGDLNRHLKIHKYESYSCEYCTKTFTRLDNLKRHLIDGCERGEFPCSQCSKVAPTERSLKRHMKINHESGSLVSCELCNKMFGSSFQYQVHKKREHKELKFPCTLCDKNYTREICKERRYV